MYRIFIVEDDPGIARGIKKQMESWNLEARCAVDFEKIMEEFQDYHPHLVLLDISLPFYNGYYWCQEIRKSIHSQILTVFFMPLIGAGIHTAFAFPMIYRLLQLFSLHNMWLLIGITGGCFLGFGLVYVLMYLLTSRSYYKIVRGGNFNSSKRIC